jgi:hypothetical protein
MVNWHKLFEEQGFEALCFDSFILKASQEVTPASRRLILQLLNSCNS